MAFHLGGASDVPNEIFAHAVHKATTVKVAFGKFWTSEKYN